MNAHATDQNPTRKSPLFSPPTPTLGAPEIPNWHRLETELQQAIVILLTQMIANHLPSPRPRDGREVADEPR